MTQLLQFVSDEQLLCDLEAAVVRERGATAQVIALLGEMDTRRLYLQQGYSSLFTYCTGYLHLSEHAAYGRIEAARAARKFPAVLDRLADGSITLTAIFDRALTLLLREVERQKLGQVDQPRSAGLAKAGGRRVSAAVRREVWARDRGQCAFVGAKGRCDERGFLEFHHVVPFAEGGETTAENLQLRCRAHNAYEAREQFGSSLLRERIERCGV